MHQVFKTHVEWVWLVMLGRYCRVIYLPVGPFARQVNAEAGYYSRFILQTHGRQMEAENPCLGKKKFLQHIPTQNLLPH